MYVCVSILVRVLGTNGLMASEANLMRCAGLARREIIRVCVCVCVCACVCVSLSVSVCVCVCVCGDCDRHELFGVKFCLCVCVRV